MLTPVITFAIFKVLSGRISIVLVKVMQFTLQTSYEGALNIYTKVFRNNSITLIYISLVVVFIILFHFSLSWFGKYFDNINQGIDALVDGSKEYIKMPYELKSVEEKLNTVRNTLETQKAEAILAEQKKNDLIMYLAHDIKTPLTSVTGYLSLLDEMPDMSEEQKIKYTHIALEKAIRLEQLINEFFEITRMNQQDMELAKQDIDLYYMFVQLADEAYPIVSEKGNRIEIHADENITVFGDPDKLARVFNNILKNAIAYSNNDSSIIIGAEKNEENVIITFSNTGKTIPAEKQSAIFEKFCRLDEARSTNTGGAGLGLAIAKQIVILHGGTIKVSSEQNVTTFEITLPIRKN
jgi:two-component system sensor histidine kinase VanS